MNDASHERSEPGIRKAALFMAGLDQAAADRLLDRMEPRCARLLRQAMMEIDRIDPEQQQRVAEEFRRMETLTPDPSPAGIELDRIKNSPAKAADATEPFEFLREADAEILSRVLSAERPRTIALVLSHLAPRQAAAVLAHFDPAVQVEAVRRLADLPCADPETLRQVGEALETRLSRQVAVAEGRAGGPDCVGRILAACDDQTADDILENLAVYDPSLAELLGRRTLEFDDLEQLDDASLLATIRAADAEVALAALVGAAPSLVQRILGGMKPAEAQAWRRRIECPDPIRLSDIEQAQEQIAALARRTARGRAASSTWAA